MSGPEVEELPDGPPDVPDELVEQMPSRLQAWALEVKEHYLALRQAGLGPQITREVIVAGVGRGWFDGNESPAQAWDEGEDELWMPDGWTAD